MNLHTNNREMVSEEIAVASNSEGTEAKSSSYTEDSQEIGRAHV